MSSGYLNGYISAFCSADVSVTCRGFGFITFRSAEDAKKALVEPIKFIDVSAEWLLVVGSSVEVDGEPV